MTNKTQWVNLLQGTDSTHDFSTGNTLPLVARPWGMHHWTLQTGKSPWTFNRREKKLMGIRLTHQPSPWMQEYGSLMVLPFNGPYIADITAQSSAYRLEDTVLTPSYMKAELLRYGIYVEMAPTKRCGLFKFSTSRTEQLKVRLDFKADHELEGSKSKSEFRGWTSDAFEGEHLINFSLKFVGRFSVSPEEFIKTNEGGYFVFPIGVKEVTLQLGASFIDYNIAQVSLTRELAGATDPLELSKEGGEEWNSLLNRINIEESSVEQKKTFYSCLYRCLLFPRFLDEIDGKGNRVHYSPYDGKIREGRLCTDTGFWDTYRTLYPLLTLVYPDVISLMMEGWMNVCRESGWTPRWSSPGARNCMIGTHFDVLAADLVVKGLTDWGVEEAFEYLWKDATIPGTCGSFGRQGLSEFIKYGYVPADKAAYSVSCTLDYAYDDFCIAQVAKFLGRDKEADELLKRSQNYRNVFDASVGFMRPKDSHGEWVKEFDEFLWGGAYIEGGPWQHTFNVPHDVEGLASLWGGNDALCQKLDEMLATPPHFRSGTYEREIHEMTEMAVAPFGQYAHSNQPVHNFLFLYALCGKPEKTDYWVGRVLNELYSSEFFPGDEDNGEMSAWYIWATLGLYPFCPGKPEYLKIKPHVRKATLNIPGLQEPLVISPDGVSGQIIKHAELLGQPVVMVQ